MRVHTMHELGAGQCIPPSKHVLRCRDLQQERLQTVDVTARQGGNLSTQFPLATVIQILKEAGVDLPADASTSASCMPSEVAAPDADNLDLVNMPATFDYEGDETS